MKSVDTARAAKIFPPKSGAAPARWRAPAPPVYCRIAGRPPGDDGPPGMSGEVRLYSAGMTPGHISMPAGIPRSMAQWIVSTIPASTPVEAAHRRHNGLPMASAAHAEQADGVSVPKRMPVDCVLSSMSGLRIDNWPAARPPSYRQPCAAASLAHRARGRASEPLPEREIVPGMIEPCQGRTGGACRPVSPFPAPWRMRCLPSALNSHAVGWGEVEDQGRPVCLDIDDIELRPQPMPDGAVSRFRADLFVAAAEHRMTPADIAIQLLQASLRCRRPRCGSSRRLVDCAV